MKKTILFILLAVMTLGQAIAQTENTSLRFDEKIHDFGTVKELGGKVTHRFKFTNTGKEPVAILNVRAGCVCVKGWGPKEPVKPGQSDYITVTFDPEYRPGHFSKELQVISDGKRYNRLWVKGDVTAGVRDLTKDYPYTFGSGLIMNYKVMNFGALHAGQSRTMKLRFANNGKEPMNLNFEITGAGMNFTVDVPAGFILQPRATAEMPVTVTVRTPFEGQGKAAIVPVANGRKLTPLPIEIKSQE